METIVIHTKKEKEKVTLTEIKTQFDKLGKATLESSYESVGFALIDKDKNGKMLLEVWPEGERTVKQLISRGDDDWEYYFQSYFSKKKETRTGRSYEDVVKKGMQPTLVLYVIYFDEDSFRELQKTYTIEVLLSHADKVWEEIKSTYQSFDNQTLYDTLTSIPCGWPS